MIAVRYIVVSVQITKLVVCW